MKGFPMHIQGAMLSNADILIDQNNAAVFNNCFFFNCRIAIRVEMQTIFQNCHFHESCVFDAAHLLRVSNDCIFDQKPALAS